ncbi:hypothetical protein MERGE_002310 [Pneumocystis wakefieldiae]|uniref:Uncharacterized protein n=1 Tax=Pneumocystis wakefieldiae TaxID=38082 RepID=A0A899FX45_9ASCO|nr:hypothetical protein MERGE_002310 [Pneumocystis wakefieldiae]
MCAQIFTISGFFPAKTAIFGQNRCPDVKIFEGWIFRILRPKYLEIAGKRTIFGIFGRFRGELGTHQIAHLSPSFCGSSRLPKKTMISGKKIGTHSGTFHADECLAVYMLRLLPEFKNSGS